MVKLLLNKPHKVHVVLSSSLFPVSGIVTIGDELFFTFFIRNSSYSASNVHVYKWSHSHFVPSHTIPLLGLTQIAGLSHSSLCNCLYTSAIEAEDESEEPRTSIWRLDLRSNNVDLVGVVNVTGYPTVSFTTIGTVLVERYLPDSGRTHQIQEYTLTGDLIREFNYADHILHAVLLSDGTLVIAFYKPGRVCISDESWNIVKCHNPFENAQQLSPDFFLHAYIPIYLEVDKYGNILVSDTWCNTIEILDRDLKLLGEVELPNLYSKKMEGECRTYLDEENGRLFVGKHEFYGGSGPLYYLQV